MLQTLQLLPPDLTGSMRKAVGFRNVVVQNSQEVEWGIVSHMCHHTLDDLRVFAQAIAAILPE